jgi:hypothetical protein
MLNVSVDSYSSFQLRVLNFKLRYDTPSVTVAATVSKQYLTMYFVSLNEILACLVCIVNVGKFEFQFQTLFFLFKPSLLALVL